MSSQTFPLESHIVDQDLDRKNVIHSEVRSAIFSSGIRNTYVGRRFSRQTLDLPQLKNLRFTKIGLPSIKFTNLEFDLI